jgi:hypothetical protein
MATTIPVPIQFSLPPGWTPAPPDEVGAPDAAFVALHPASRDDFTANITIAGEVRASAVPLPQLADEVVAKLRQVAGNVRVSGRTTVGTPENPGLSQRVSLRLSDQELVQLQVFLGMADVRDVERRVVLHVALTATPAQFQAVAGDFKEFVRSIRPE